MTGYDVMLEDTGRNKISVIKAIIELTGLGLKEAKDLADQPPSVILANVQQDKADQARAALENAGARASLRGSGGGQTMPSARYDVLLVSGGKQRKLANALRKHTSLSMQEAYQLAGQTNVIVLSDASEDTAFGLKATLEAEGALVNVERREG